jgi:hypothetical protein
VSAIFLFQHKSNQISRERESVPAITRSGASLGSSCLTIIRSEYGVVYMIETYHHTFINFDSLVQRSRNRVLMDILKFAQRKVFFKCRRYDIRL